MATYVQNKVGAFKKREDGIPPQKKRSECRMKRYSSTTDSRAWINNAHENKAFIFHFMGEDPAEQKKHLTVGQIIPVDMIWKILMCNKNNYISDLEDRIECFVDLLHRINLSKAQLDRIRYLTSSSYVSIKKYLIKLKVIEQVSIDFEKGTQAAPKTKNTMAETQILTNTVGLKTIPSIRHVSTFTEIQQFIDRSIGTIPKTVSDVSLQVLLPPCLLADKCVSVRIRPSSEKLQAKKSMHEKPTEISHEKFPEIVAPKQTCDKHVITKSASDICTKSSKGKPRKSVVSFSSKHELVTVSSGQKRKQSSKAFTSKDSINPLELLKMINQNEIKSESNESFVDVISECNQTSFSEGNIYPSVIQLYRSTKKSSIVSTLNQPASLILEPLEDDDNETKHFEDYDTDHSNEDVAISNPNFTEVTETNEAKNDENENDDNQEDKFEKCFKCPGCQEITTGEKCRKCPGCQQITTEEECKKCPGCQRITPNEECRKCPGCQKITSNKTCKKCPGCQRITPEERCRKCPGCQRVSSEEILRIYPDCQSLTPEEICRKCPDCQRNTSEEIRRKIPDGQSFTSEDICRKCPDCQRITSEEIRRKIPDGQSFTPEEICRKCPDCQRITSEEIRRKIPDGQSFTPEEICRKCPDCQRITSEEICRKIPDGQSFTPEEICRKCPDCQRITSEEICRKIPDGQSFTPEEICRECPDCQRITSSEICRKCPDCQSLSPEEICRKCPGCQRITSDGTCRKCPGCQDTQDDTDEEIYEDCRPPTRDGQRKDKETYVKSCTPGKSSEIKNISAKTTEEETNVHSYITNKKDTNQNIVKEQLATHKKYAELSLELLDVIIHTIHDNDVTITYIDVNRIREIFNSTDVKNFDNIDAGLLLNCEECLSEPTTVFIEQLLLIQQLCILIISTDIPIQEHFTNLETSHSNVVNIPGSRVSANSQKLQKQLEYYKNKQSSLDQINMERKALQEHILKLENDLRLYDSIKYKLVSDPEVANLLEVPDIINEICELQQKAELSDQLEHELACQRCCVASLKENLSDMSANRFNEYENLRYKAQEADILRIELDRLQIQCNEMQKIRSENVNLHHKCADLEKCLQQTPLEHQQQLPSAHPPIKEKDLQFCKEQAAEIEQLKNEKQALLCTVVIKECELVDQEDQIDRLVKHVDRLTTDYEDQQEKSKQIVSQLRSDLKSKESYISALDVDLEKVEERLKESITKVSKDSNHFQHKLCEVEDACRRYKLKNDEMEDTINALRKKLERQEEVNRQYAIELQNKDKFLEEFSTGGPNDEQNLYQKFNRVNRMECILRKSHNAVRKVVEELAKQYRCDFKGIQECVPEYLNNS